MEAGVEEEKQIGETLPNTVEATGTKLTGAGESKSDGVKKKTLKKKKRAMASGLNYSSDSLEFKEFKRGTIDNERYALISQYCREQQQLQLMKQRQHQQPQIFIPQAMPLMPQSGLPHSFAAPIPLYQWTPPHLSAYMNEKNSSCEPMINRENILPLSYENYSPWDLEQPSVLSSATKPKEPLFQTKRNKSPPSPAVKLNERDKYYRHKRRHNRRIVKRLDAIISIGTQIIRKFDPSINLIPIIDVIKSTTVSGSDTSDAENENISLATLFTNMKDQ